ncbi:MAG: sigma 54-interacting transcriptional regulator [Bacillota bacterium]
MKLTLTSIQEFVQEVVHAIASVIGVEVMVFDASRNIVAGTGETYVEVGNRYNEGSLTGRLLATGRPLIARRSGQCAECAPCTRYGSCPHYAVVAYPIKVEGQILGSFCLVAIDENQRQKVLESEERLMHFLEHMCLLIGSALSERNIRDELNVLLKRYDNVVNSIHEGIIATDEAGRITHFNYSAANLLGIKSPHVLGKFLTELFPDLPIAELISQKKGLETEVCYQQKRQKRYFLATVSPVLTSERQEVRGVTVSFRSLSEVQSYSAKLIGETLHYTFDDIQTRNEPLLEIKSRLSRAALTDSTILICGESGTGKELFAQAIHNASYRAGGPFVAINCSAIPESLLESELFGYEEGAFTGARKGGKPGKFELARGGTLFLDEIGDMPLHLQSKLLRVLENRCIERVGGTKSIPIDVRIVAATNRNLEEMVERREFRGDLFYRLNVIPVLIPPLRERREDIPLLIDHFLTKYSLKMNRSRQELAGEALELLTAHHWPGNVRELQNAIEYAINMSEPGQKIGVEHLPRRIFAASAETETIENTNGGEKKNPDKESQPPKTGKSKLKEMEVKAIREALDRFGNSTEGKEKAARYLGISRATLYRRLKEIGEEH